MVKLGAEDEKCVYRVQLMELLESMKHIFDVFKMYATVFANFGYVIESCTFADIIVNFFLLQYMWIALAISINSDF